MLTATVQPQKETSCSQANLCHAFAQSELRVPKLPGEPRVSKTAKPVLVNCDQPTEKRSAFLKFSKTVLPHISYGGCCKSWFHGCLLVPLPLALTPASAAVVLDPMCS